MINRIKHLRECKASWPQIAKYYLWDTPKFFFTPNKSIVKNITIKGGHITPHKKHVLIKGCVFDMTQK